MLANTYHNMPAHLLVTQDTVIILMIELMDRAPHMHRCIFNSSQVILQGGTEIQVDYYFEEMQHGPFK